MASYIDDLTCSICLTFFMDPVTLVCGHSYCRSCLTNSLKIQQKCPQCRASLASGEKVTDIATNFVLLSLAEKAKQGDDFNQIVTAKAEVTEMCPEHDEKLKLYCVTDQQLTCIICRDGEQHEGHTFKPIKEAAASLKRDLEKGLGSIPEDIKTLESSLNAQRKTINATKDRSCQLVSQISAQFGEMHRFLQKREEELKNDVKRQENDKVEQMTEVLNAIEAELSQSRELQLRAASVLEISDPEKFLKSWSGGNSVLLQEAFRPRANDHPALDASLSLGPYESHLKFFVWKEMLQEIEPREEQLVLKERGVQFNLSNYRRSVVPCSDIQLNTRQTPLQHYNDPVLYSMGYEGLPGLQSRRSVPTERFATSVDEFMSGQHYWEIEVGQIGQEGFWQVGIKDHTLQLNGENLSANCPEGVTPLTLQNIPRKIGIYLDMSSQTLSFYNAANMAHIHTVSTKRALASPMSAFLKFRGKTENIPFTVCWY